MLPATLLHLNERSNIWAPSTVPIWVKTNKRNMLKQFIMCKYYMRRMIASQSCYSKPPSGQCGRLCPAYDAVCNQPADLRRLRPKLPQVGTKPSNLQSRRWASIYSNVGRLFCTPAPPKFTKQACCGFFFQLRELI